MPDGVQGRVPLLDVNVLVALFDGAHLHHEAAHTWFERVSQTGWASCALTENGTLRVLTNPSYTGRFSSLHDVADRLRELRTHTAATFWDASVSLLEAGQFDLTHIAGHRQLTDTYLLGLAVAHGGYLATFDRRISTAAVRRAKPEHLLLIGAAGTAMWEVTP